jgi:hypothetical protein
LLPSPALAGLRLFPPVIQRCKASDLDAVNEEISVSVALDNAHPGINYYETKGTNVTLGSLSQAIDDGKIYYASEASGSATKVTKQAINELWDDQYKGFTRTGTLDWSRNCAEYAIGESISNGDINASKEHLAQKWTRIHSEKPELDELKKTFEEKTGTFVCSVGSHFLRLEIPSKGGTVTASPKDAESCSYTKAMTGGQAAELLRGDDTFTWVLYLKK